MTKLRAIYLSIAAVLLIASCNNTESLYDLGNTSYQLVDSDSSAVAFPNDFKGEYSLVTFIYTNCPDMCKIITANMINIQQKLADTADVNFIEISFDPERDTPSALADYRQLYDLNRQFTLLTGDTTTVKSLLEKVDILAMKVYPDSVNADSANYAMKHSNTLYLMDKEGRIRAEYPATVVPPKNVIEDLNAIRN